VRNIISRLDPEAAQKEEAKKKASAASQKLSTILENKARYDSDDEDYDSNYKRPRKEDLVLTSYEQTIAMEVVAPEEIPVTFEGRGVAFFLLVQMSTDCRGSGSLPCSYWNLQGQKGNQVYIIACLLTLHPRHRRPRLHN
jgi:hypothetical protein